MKGVGTVRRALLSMAALVGFGNVNAGLVPPTLRERFAEETKHDEPRRRVRKHRSRKATKAKGLPMRVVYALRGVGNKPVGNYCPKLLSRKKLKQLCPGHPLLRMEVK